MPKCMSCVLGRVQNSTLKGLAATIVAEGSPRAKNKQTEGPFYRAPKAGQNTSEAHDI